MRDHQRGREPVLPLTVCIFSCNGPPHQADQRTSFLISPACDSTGTTTCLERWFLPLVSKEKGCTVAALANVTLPLEDSLLSLTRLGRPISRSRHHADYRCSILGRRSRFPTNGRAG